MSSVDSGSGGPGSHEPRGRHDAYIDRESASVGSLVAPLLLATVTGAMAIEAWGYEAPARYYPAVILTVLTILLLQVTWRNRRTRRHESPSVGEPMRWGWRVIAFSAVWALYPVVMMSLGFLTATTAGLIASLLLLRIHHPWRYAIGVVPTTVAVFGTLQVVLNIALPATPLERAVAGFFYGLGG